MHCDLLLRFNNRFKMANNNPSEAKFGEDERALVVKEEHDVDYDETLHCGSQDLSLTGSCNTTAKPPKRSVWPELVIVDWKDDIESSEVVDDPLSVNHFCQVTIEGETTGDVTAEAGACSSIKVESEEILFTGPSSDDICDFPSGTAGLMKKSKKACVGRKIHACTLCDYQTRTQSDFKRHQKIHARYKCEVCYYRFSEAYEIETHTCEMPYTCDFCNYRCRGAHSLRRHLKIHSGHKPYSCNFCGLSFYRPCHLKQHMRTHTGERPYACDICDYRFSQSSTLSRHMKTHTGEKPFSCEVCGRSFRQKCQLKKHTKTHTEQRYACQVCGLGFHQVTSLNDHLRTQHWREVLS